MTSVEILPSDICQEYEHEAQKVDKDYVFEEGELFIPIAGCYEDRTVYPPYRVFKRFSIQRVIDKFKDNLSLGSCLIEEQVNVLLELMTKEGYIVKQPSVKSYSFGDYYFLNNHALNKSQN
jgi:hypothetical protein